MSKERVEEILDDIPSQLRHMGELEPLKEIARDQAERLQESEENNIALLEALRFQDEDLAKQNKAYREVLGFYGNKDNYMKYVGMQPITPTIEIDSGKKAREVINND